MKVGILFSGGKDSTYAAFLARKYGHDLTCLITLVSKNPESHMFHTPLIALTEQQATLMKIPLLRGVTLGNEDQELQDLKEAIEQARREYEIEGVVTGAVGSLYQATRIQKICAELHLEVFNPVWQKEQLELLRELVQNQFDIMVTAVAADPLDETWVGKHVDLEFIEKVEKLQNEFGINPAGEGGEFETLVMNCPLFEKKLDLGRTRVSGSGNAFRFEVVE